ncbi:unnamed protein product, partial [Rotaria socialis]
DEDQSSTYNIEEAKARLQNMDKTDKEAYRALIKQKHKDRRLKEKEARKAAREARRLKKQEDEEESNEDEEKNIENGKEMNVDNDEEEERLERKRSLSPPPQAETKRKKKKQRSLTEFINDDSTKTINDTEQLALYLLSK